MGKEANAISVHRSAVRQARGAWAERLAGEYLTGLGWRIVATNLRVGRDEIDLLAVEPGEPQAIVVVEVRGLHTREFGAPEERVDRAKVGRLYRAVAALRVAAELPGGEAMPGGSWRVDLVVVDARDGPPRLRHLRALEPP